jgi:hypothetical protein
VHERHIKEDTRIVAYLAVDASVDALERNGQRPGVLRESLRFATEHVSRELVEDDDECQTTARGLQPIVALTTHDRVVELAELVPNLSIESGILLPPTRGVDRIYAPVLVEVSEPKLEDIVEVEHGCHFRHADASASTRRSSGERTRGARRARERG